MGLGRALVAAPPPGSETPLSRKRRRGIGLCVWFLGFLSLFNFDSGSCQQLIESTRYAVDPIYLFGDRVIESFSALPVIVNSMTKPIAVSKGKTYEDGLVFLLDNVKFGWRPMSHLYAIRPIALARRYLRIRRLNSDQSDIQFFFIWPVHANCATEYRWRL